MKLVGILLVAGLVFGVCFLVDKAFAKLFRSKAQHLSGLAIRVNTRYGVFGVIFSVLGILALLAGNENKALLIGGIVVLVTGLALAVYYLGFGIFYDGETFLYCVPFKKSAAYCYKDIRQQRLYQIQGGNIVIELHLADGKAVSLQSTMEGVYPFLDTAFAGWCMQTGHDPKDCGFYDPQNSWWFPHEENV